MPGWLIAILLLSLSTVSAADSSRPVLWARGDAVYVAADDLTTGDRLHLLDAEGVRRGEAVVRIVGVRVAVADRIEGPRPERGWRAEVGVRPRWPEAPVEVAPALPPPSPSRPRAVRLPAAGPVVERWRIEGLEAPVGDVEVDGALVHLGVIGGRFDARLDLDADGTDEIWRLEARGLAAYDADGGEIGRTGAIPGAPVGLAVVRVAGASALAVAYRTNDGAVVIEILVGRRRGS